MGRALSSQLRRNMLSGPVVTLVSFAITMVSYPLYLRYLGYESYGIWLVLSTVLSFAQLGNLGINAAVAKIVAEEWGHGDKEAISKVLSVAISSLAVSGALVLVTICLLKSQIVGLFKLSAGHSVTVEWLLPYMAFLSVYVFVVEVCNSTLSGLGRMDLANSAQVLGRLAAISSSALLLHLGYGVGSLLLANLLSYLVIHLQTVVHIKGILKSTGIRLGFFDREIFRRLMRVGGFMSASSVLVMLFDPFNKMMMSRYAGLSLVPVYDLAFRGSMQLRGVIESALRAIMPEVSRLSSRSDESSCLAIEALNAKACKMILLAGVALFLPLGLGCEPLLKLWLGQAYNPALPAAFRMSIAAVFASLLGVPSYYTLLGLGRVHYLTLSHVIQSGTNLLMAVLIALLAPGVFFNTLFVSIILAVMSSTTYLVLNFRREMKTLRSRYEVARADAGVLPSGVS